ncbi:hypothetical protein L0636_00825 [Halomonas janggokensis]|uniref:Baseplate protein J-like domain-containing protein n=1 Tax=Vreelandella janggokensis TaxID=370767 RepID=A0ABT4IRY9_9GAMM|nr:hypothetical protein [Halomonas janggokensis]MCZ0926430.1 hypothetical protein [Halomonas janggokensis]MCZ0928968.1 hypothetical protein [Halomonas janggokensis]
MLTRDDFQQAIDDSVARYPAVGALYRARDPRILQHLDAMATMLSMYSSQLEVAQAEPFEKVRDATVLADASMRGLVPKAQPSRVSIRLKNSSNAAFSASPGRALIDSNGRPFRIETPIDAGPGDTVSFEAIQLSEKPRVHTVQESRAFYAIEVELADDDSWLCGLHVTDEDGSYEHRERYTNTIAGERIYHVEADERRRVYVRFGQDGVVGVQPTDGRQLTITSYYSLGRIDDFQTGSPMAFETMQGPNEAQLEMTLESVSSNGENPPSMRALRELAKYPSVYNHNAVFLGEFDFLVRRHFPSLQFLSVWNEGVEERHRGMSVDNINALFVACLSAAENEAVLTQQPGEETEPQLVDEGSLTATQTAIRDRIHASDNSYRVRFYSAIRAPLAVSITATVATSYDESVVRDQIRQVMLNEFGEQADQSRRGQSSPLYQQVYQLLRKQVPALSVGRADLQVAIEEPEGAARPELWRYVSPESLEVSVTVGNVNVPFWGSGL